MKVYRVNEYDFVYAENQEQAIEHYLDETGLSLEETIDESYFEEHELDKGKMWIPVSDLEEGDKDKVHDQKRFGDSLYVYVTYGYVINRFNLIAPHIISTTD